MSAMGDNLQLLTDVATALGDLRERLVFVGGCATELLITVPQAQMIRVTRDVDAIVSVVSLPDYHSVETELITRGFNPDTSEGAPRGRWLVGGAKLDLMPSEPIGMPHNRWYRLAVRTATRFGLRAGIPISLIAAPVFVATKIEAFRGRGEGDFLGSHDMEDIIHVVDGRPELVDEAVGADDELRGFLSEAFGQYLEAREFLEAISGLLPGDTASQQRRPIILDRLKRIAARRG